MKRFINATKDLTDVDIARQTYYRLQAEQSAWDIQKSAKKKKVSYTGYMAFIGTVIVLVLLAGCEWVVERVRR